MNFVMKLWLTAHFCNMLRNQRVSEIPVTTAVSRYGGGLGDPPEAVYLESPLAAYADNLIWSVKEC